MTIKPIRHHLYRMQEPDYGTLYCVAIDVEPSYLGPDTFAAARVTVTTRTHDFPGWIRLSAGDPTPGYIDTFDQARIEYDELAEDLGALSAETAHTLVRTLVRRLEKK